MKYMGSKRRIRKDILPLMLKNRHSDQYFVEPFCGGCNVIAHVDGNRLAADINPYLIAMFQGLLNGKQPPQRIDKPLYRKASAQYRSGVGSLSDFEMGWVGFMASFRSKFFSSYAGNTRDGRDYIREAIGNINRQIHLLKGIRFNCCDYRDLHIPPCSIIYCDIPYRGTTRFEKVPAFSHTDFYEWCFSMKNAGHTVFISEYAMPDAFKLVWEKPIVKNLGDKKTMQAERLYTI
mgnify:CR=1 FL=1